MKKNCIFCEIKQEEIIKENNSAIAIYDNFPVNPGHVLIISKSHRRDWFETDIQEKIEIMELIDEIKIILDSEFSPHGYNIGMNCGEKAGQSIPHLHVHLIPRYSGDMENPRGGVRGVIPNKQNY